MFRSGNVYGITKYLLLIVLTVSSECLAAVNRVQNGDSHKEVFSKSSSRSLLYSWDDDDRTKTRYNYNNDNAEKVVYIVVSIFIAIIVLICRCCIKYGCSNEEENNYSNAIVHPPPRSSATVAPPPSSFGYNTYSGSSSNVLSPPRSSRSIILPIEAQTFPTDLLGYDNPNYQPENTSSERYYSPLSQNQTPLCDILDMPPPYDTVVKEDVKYPSTKQK